MKPLRLKSLLVDLGKTQKDLSQFLTCSAALVAQIVNHQQWPKSYKQDALMQSIRTFLHSCGANEMQLANAFEQVNESEVEVNEAVQMDATPVRDSAEGRQFAAIPNQEDVMLLRRQNLTQAAKKHFGLAGNPFLNDVQSREDVFISPEIRYVRESMWQTANFGGFDAIIGESGAGKSTLRRELVDRISRDEAKVVLIEPYVLGMEENDSKGKTLKALHICEAILSALNPLATAKRSPEARFKQIHEALKDSFHNSKKRHCLLIEEAHCLPTATLKQLKRFLELEAGFSPLLSIILIGQPELYLKLSASNHEVREVVSRCSVTKLSPLDAQLEDYLRFKFKRLNKSLTDIIDTSGLEALRQKMTFDDGSTKTSMLYPLAVGNLMTSAMNTAAYLGAPIITSDLVRTL